MVPPQNPCENRQPDRNCQTDLATIGLERAQHLILAQRIVNLTQEHVLLRGFALVLIVFWGTGTQGQCEMPSNLLGKMPVRWNSGLFSDWGNHFNGFDRCAHSSEAAMNELTRDHAMHRP